MCVCVCARRRRRRKEPADGNATATCDALTIINVYFDSKGLEVRLKIVGYESQRKASPWKMFYILFNVSSLRKETVQIIFTKNLNSV